MKEDRFSPKRMIRMLGILISVAIYSVFLAIICKFTIDRVLVLVFINALYLPLLIAVIEMERIRGHLNRNEKSDFHQLFLCFLAAAACYVGFFFMPAYMAPVMIPVMILSCGGNELIGILDGIYFNTLLCMCSSGSFYEYAAYTMLTVLSGILLMVISQKKYKIYGCIMTVALSFAVPSIFYYISSFEINYHQYLSAGCSMILTAVFSYFFADRLYYYTKHEKERTLAEIIAENFPLVQEIKNYSEIDYAHARKVSSVAEECAKELGADDKTVAAAGFYYRIGKLEGEPFVENGVRLAEINCFPKNVVKILSEYNGELNAISSIESAIVHIVDSIVTKFELLDKETVKNSWNHDIIIYQTLNEKSAAGLYDEANLGMNQFIKIREFCDMNMFEQILQQWCEATGMSAVALDSDGEYITKEIGMTDFCTKYTRSTQEGRNRCDKCNKEGKGVYFCHTGLMDFSMDIKVEGKVVGKIIGGQVLPHEPEEEQMKEVARQIGVDPDKYYQAAKRVAVRPENAIRAAAELLESTVNMFVNHQYVNSKNGTLIEVVTSNIEEVSSLLKDINDKSRTLDKIESKQRILALNASIEAGRAGEMGKGFAVVANEVGNLASNSGDVNKTIKNILKQLNEVVGKIAEESRRTMD